MGVANHRLNINDRNELDTDIGSMNKELSEQEVNGGSDIITKKRSKCD